jgi:hypothetical protein
MDCLIFNNTSSTNTLLAMQNEITYLLKPAGILKDKRFFVLIVTSPNSRLKMRSDLPSAILKVTQSIFG